MKTTRILLIASLMSLIAAVSTQAHCEIPCGIYDDSARIDAMREHVTTIEKSMKQIVELSTATPRNDNQIVRWVMNKEDHADYLQEIATQYFMFQRIKPADQSDAKHWAEYINRLTLLHRITVETMKAKQTTDLTHIEQLRSLINEFAKAYFGHE